MSPDEGLSVDMLEMSQPFLYYQPALSFLFNGPFSSKRLPTQLVCPDGRVALGQVPNISKTRKPNDSVEVEEEEEDDESRIARLRQETIVAFACPNDQQIFEAPLVFLSIYLLLCIAFQTMWIGVILSGGQILTFGSAITRSDVDGVDDEEFSSPQRIIYINMLLLHLLPLVAILYRLELPLSIYSLMQFVNFVLVFTCCLYSALDILVLTSIIPVQILASKIEGFIASHVFALKKEQQLL